MSSESGPSAESLDRTFVGGLAWTAGSKWVTQGLTWISVLIVARLLSPADFGLVEMAGLFFVIANVLAEFGIGTAVVQMRGLGRDVLAQLNTLSVAFSTLAFGIALLAAPAIAAFFRSDEVRMLVAVNSLAFFVTGFQAVPQGVLRRDLDYRRLSVAEAVQSVVQAVTTVAAAWFGLAYWSLVIGHVLGKSSSAVLTVIWTRVPLRWPRMQTVRAPLKFGYHVSVANLAGTFYAMADVIVVGRRLGDDLLGHYRMALTLAYAPIDKIGALIMRVTGPLFARIQSDHVLIRRYFLIFTEILTLAVLPMCIGIALVASELVTVVLGAKWLVSVGPLQFVSLFAGVRLISVLISQILVALHRTAFTMHLSLISLFVMPVAFWFAAGWSLAAVGAAWLLLAVINVLPSYIVMARQIELPFRDFAGAFVPSFIGCAVMAAGVASLRPYLQLQPDTALLDLVVQSLIGAALYSGVILLFFRSRTTRYIRFVKNLRQTGVPA